MTASLAEARECNRGRKVNADRLTALGSATPAGRRRLEELDDLARTRWLSPDGSGDLRSAAMFLNFFAIRQTEPGTPPCRH